MWSTLPSTIFVPYCSLFCPFTSKYVTISYAMVSITGELSCPPPTHRTYQITYLFIVVIESIINNMINLKHNLFSCDVFWWKFELYYRCMQIKWLEIIFKTFEAFFADCGYEYWTIKSCESERVYSHLRVKMMLCHSNEWITSKIDERQHLTGWLCTYYTYYYVQVNMMMLTYARC